MKAKVTRKYTFEAAHWLPMVHPGHKCGRMHGHSFEIEVTVVGDIKTTEGWALDFARIDAQAQPLVDLLEHQTINDVIENPTSENIALWFLSRLPNAASVKVSESRRSSVEVSREVLARDT